MWLKAQSKKILAHVGLPDFPETKYGSFLSVDAIKPRSDQCVCLRFHI